MGSPCAGHAGRATGDQSQGHLLPEPQPTPSPSFCVHPQTKAFERSTGMITQTRKFITGTGE